MSLLAELKRRRVIRIALIYLAGAWLTVEVASELGSIFEIPLWIPRLLVVVLALVFPVVIALSWVFDVTPDGVRRTDPKSASGKVVVTTAVSMLLIGIGAAYTYLAPEENELARNTIAVMPCDNWTDDREMAYLTDGLSEDIMGRLTRLPPISVISRNSTFALRNMNLDAKAIGARVGARYVLTCSLRKSDDLLLINVQLTDGKSNKTVDTMNFNRPYDRLIDVLNEIAVTVATDMSREVLGKDRSLLRKHGTVNMDALDAYMRGRFHANQMTGDSHTKAIAHYEQALRLDPGFAAPHVFIANSMIFLRQFHSERGAKYRDAIMSNIDLALELNDELASAWAIKGHALMEFDRNWSESLVALERAYELDPSNLEANNYLRQYYALVGPARKMLPYAKNALRIDPIGPFTSAQLIFTYETMRQYESALDASEQSLELDRNFWLFHWPRSWLFAWTGRYEEAMESVDRAILLWGSDDNVDLIATRGAILAKMGRMEAARTELNKLLLIDAAGHLSPMYQVMILAAMGRIDECLNLVERAHEQQDWLLPWVHRSAFVDPLRNEGRYKDVIRALGLVDEGYLDTA